MRRDVNFDEEKDMRCSLEWELSIPLEQELLAPKEEPQDELQEVVQKPHAKEQTRGRVEAPTQPESSREGRKISIEVDRLLHDHSKNVRSPTLQRR